MQRVGEEIETSRGDHFGVELAQRSRTGVARIGEQRFLPGGSLLVDGCKGAVGDQGFAAHLHPGRRLVQVQLEWNRRDRAHVGGDVLPLLAIASRGSSHQHAVLVAQGQGVAVDLQFTDHGQGRRRYAYCRLPIEHFEQPPIPTAQLIGAEGVVEAEQGNAVGNAAESLRRGRTHALGRTLGND